jgi:hypothetical protein
MMQVFFPLAEQGANPQLEADLAQRSASFRTIRDKSDRS